MFENKLKSYYTHHLLVTCCDDRLHLKVGEIHVSNTSIDRWFSFARACVIITTFASQGKLNVIQSTRPASFIQYAIL